MDLEKKNIRMSQIKCVKERKITLDDDFNVPDKKPDIERVIREQGNIMITEQKLEKGNLSLGGILKFSVLYLSDDKKRPIHSMKGEVPFHEVIPMEQAEETDNITITQGIDDLSVSLINSRKINLRAVCSFHCMAEELGDMQAAVSVICQEEEEKKAIQSQVAKIQISEPVFSGQDTVRIHEQLQLSNGKPNIQELLYENVVLRNVNQSAASGKLLVKGELSMTLFYMAAEGQAPECIEKMIPFEKEVAITGLQPEQMARVQTELLNQEFTIKPDEDGEPRIISAEVTLLLQMKNYKNQEICVLDDLYATNCELKVDSVQAHFQSLIMKNDSRLRLNNQFPLSIGEDSLLQICTPVGTIRIDEQRLCEQGIEVEGELEVGVLCVTDQDAHPLIAQNSFIPFSYMIDVKWGNHQPSKDYYQVQLLPSLEQLYAVLLDGSEVEIKAVIRMDTVVFEQLDCPIITSVTKLPLDTKLISELPGITGYVVEQGQSLWKIAKQYHMTIQQIMEQNHLESDVVVPGQKLLLIKSA